MLNKQTQSMFCLVNLSLFSAIVNLTIETSVMFTLAFEILLICNTFNFMVCYLFIREKTMYEIQ